VLGFGSGIAVLGPPELVDEVRRRAVEALSAYDAVEA
jgi:proteasome accessory factor C